MALYLKPWGAGTPLSSLSKSTGAAPLACAAWRWSMSLAVLAALHPAHDNWHALWAHQALHHILDNSGNGVSSNRDTGCVEGACDRGSPSICCLAGAGAAGPPEGAPGGEPLVLRWVKPPRAFRAAALACRRVSRALPEATERAPTSPSPFTGLIQELWSCQAPSWYAPCVRLGLLTAPSGQTFI